MMPARHDVDPGRCPNCTQATAQAPACPHCGLRLTGPVAQQLWNLDLAAAAMATHRAQMIAQLSRPEPHHSVDGPELPFAVPPGGAGPEHPLSWSPTAWRGGPGNPDGPAGPAAPSILFRLTPQQLLLSAGAVLIVLACLFFAAQAFTTLGIVGQGVVLIGVALATTVGARAAHDRGLLVSRAALALVGTGVALTAMIAPRLMGLPAAAQLSAAYYTALVVTGGSLFAMGSAVFTRERAVGLLAVAQLSLLAPALAVGLHASSAVFALLLLLSAAAGTGALALCTPGALALCTPGALALYTPGGLTAMALRGVIVLHWSVAMVLAGPHLLFAVIRSAPGADPGQALTGGAVVACGALCTIALSVQAQRATDRPGASLATVRALPVAPMTALYAGIALLGFAASAPLVGRSPSTASLGAGIAALAAAVLLRASCSAQPGLQQRAAFAGGMAAALSWAIRVLDCASGDRGGSGGALTVALLTGVLASVLVACTSRPLRTTALMTAEVTGVLTVIAAGHWQQAPLAQTATTLMVLGSLLLIASSLRDDQTRQVLELGGFVAVALGFALARPFAPPSYGTALATFTAGLAFASTTRRRGRRGALVPAAVLMAAAVHDALSRSGPHALEVHTVSWAALILAVTVLAALETSSAQLPPVAGAAEADQILPAARWQERFAATWAAMPSRRSYGPTLAMLLVPSLLAGLNDHSFVRLGWVLVAAALTLLVGVQQRLAAPQLIGAAVLAVVALDQLLSLAAGAPRSLVFGGLGALVLAAGITYERRLAEARALKAYFTRLH